MKMQKWANASCKSALSLWVTTMHNQKYSQPRFTCKQQWLHSIFIIRRWKFHKRTVNCSQPINYILWWIYFLLKGCNVAYKSEIYLRSTRSRLNYLKLWLIFSRCKFYEIRVKSLQKRQGLQMSLDKTTMSTWLCICIVLLNGNICRHLRCSNVQLLKHNTYQSPNMHDWIIFLTRNFKCFEGALKNYQKGIWSRVNFHTWT